MWHKVSQNVLLHLWATLTCEISSTRQFAKHIHSHVRTSQKTNMALTSKENWKEGENVAGTERIWNFYVYPELSPTCPANAGTDSCGVGTSLPLSNVIYILINLCMTGILLWQICILNFNTRLQIIAETILVKASWLAFLYVARHQFYPLSFKSV